MFSRTAFNPVSFSPFSFKGASEEPKARSGYWRLLLSQMQEESLKQDELRKKREAEPTKPKKPKLVKPVAVRTAVEETEPEYEVLPYRPLPMFTPVKDTQNLAHTVFDISCQIQFLVAQYSLHAIKFKQAAVILQLQDNDEDEVELLLLTA